MVMMLPHDRIRRVQLNILRRIAFFFLLSATGWASVPPPTGQGTSTDPNYSLAGGSAFIVTTRPPTWGSQAGAQWIGPAADATRNHPAGSQGNFIFTLTFNVVDVSKANLSMTVLCDPDVDISLNSTILQGGITGTTTPTRVNLTRLVAGKNTLQFFVSDFGQGPVGLNVLFSGTLGDLGPALTITPPKLTFTQSSGTSTTQTATLTNSGGAQLNITNLKLNGDLTGFSVDLTSCLGASLAPGNSCRLPVSFSPANPGTANTSITITSNATPSQQDLVLTGTATAPSTAMIGVNPTQAGFKDTVVGTFSESGLVAVGSVGTAPLTITGITVDDPSFYLDSSACLNKTLQPQAGCLLGVQFRPIRAGSLTGKVTFATNASNTVTLTLTGRSLAPKTCVDTDDDGLCDMWETDGVHVGGAGGADVFIDLPKMGADPLYKDIFLHIDWMADSTHDHSPNRAGIQQMQNAFRAAPVDNPNGKKGINVHVDCGPDCVMDAVKGTTWGSDLSKAAKLAEKQPLYDKLLAATDPYDWSDFDKISGPFNNTGRKMIFHHVIFAHDQSLGTTSSGISRNDSKSLSAFFNGASDLIISLGSWGDKMTDATTNGGTLMHELGHNLGLAHGGADGINYKPNYLSVMNYNFQATGLIQNGYQGSLDYSRFDLPALDETDLNEPLGLNAFSLIPKYGTAWFCNKDNPNKVAPHTVLLANGWIDWNCDGYGSDGHIGHVSTNIIANYNDKGLGILLSDMKGQNDWAKVNLKGGSIGGAVTAAPVTTSIHNAEQDMTAEEAALKVSLNQLRAAAPPAVNLAAGKSATLNVVISNAGINPDTYLFTVPPVPGWISATGIPASADVVSGASVVLPVTVSAPSTAKIGDSQLVTIQAKSQFAPALASAEIRINVVAAPDEILLSTKTLMINTLTVGTKSNPSPVTVTNTGTAPIQIASIAASGDYSQTNTCGVSLAVAASCVIQVTFAPTAAGARAGTVTISDSAAGSPHVVALKAAASPLPPVIGAAIHAASGKQGAFAPGTLISIFGTGLADQQEFISGLPLPLNLGGTTVTVNDIPTPFTYAGPNQINLQIPYGLTSATATIAVTASSGLSAYLGFDVVDASPGLFVIPGTTHAAAQNPDYSTNLATNPIAPGGVIVMYFTGQGALDQTIATGAASPASPLAAVSAPVSATVGGLPATVYFAGMTPGFAGLAQANIIVPTNGSDGKPLAPGDYPVILTIGGVASNAAAISVR